MSEEAQPPDDLERLLAASRELRARYREASVEETSPALDDAIRAQARRAVGARPRSAGSPFLSTWRLPLSLAAMLVLSVTLTVMVTRQDRHLPSAEENGARRSAPAAEPPAPAPSAAAPQPARPPADEKENAPMRQEYSRESSGPARSEAPRLKKDATPSPQRSAPADEMPPQSLQKQAQPFPAAPIAQPSPAQKSERAPESEPKVSGAPGSATEPTRSSEAAEADAAARRDRTAEQERAELRPPTANAAQARGKLKAQVGASTGEERADTQRQQQAPAVAAVPESAPAAAAAAPWEANPQEWLRHIETLVRDHRMSEARDSLKAFRQRYPSYPLPSDFPLREP